MRKFFFSQFKQLLTHLLGFPGGSVVKNLPANTGDTGDESSVSGLGRSPGGGHSFLKLGLPFLLGKILVPHLLSALGQPTCTHSHNKVR